MRERCGTPCTATSAGDPATVARNTANFNGRYGIEAQNVIDGGGNRAQGNALSPQCLGVVCK